MLIRKYLSIFLIGLVFAIAGCSSGGSSSGINEELPDTDGDGINNDNDGDIDGDGIPNQNDNDIDGDGVTNDQDGDDDNDGIADGNDSTPEGPPSNDIDGDGIPNDKDPDKDGDGIPNDKDPDKDGDGKPNDKDPTPGGEPAVPPCTSAKIIVPNDDKLTGQAKVSVGWKLLPEGCELTAERNTKIRVYASNTYATDSPNSTNNVVVGKEKAKLTIPNNCNWIEGTTKSITYDFSEIGTALGDANANTPSYKQSVTHPVGQGACESPDNSAVVDLERISHHKDATCDAEASGAVSCKGATNPDGDPAQYYYVWTKVTEALPIGYYQSAPTWSATSELYMNIYFSDCDTKSTSYHPTSAYAAYNDWNKLKSGNADCLVRTNYFDGGGRGWVKLPSPGNFILKIGAAATTISKYNIPTPSSNAVDPAIADSNIARKTGITCSQNVPGLSEVTCEGSSEYWAYKKMSGVAQPLESYSKPSWDTTPVGEMWVWIESFPAEACLDAIKSVQEANSANIYCRTAGCAENGYSKAALKYQSGGARGTSEAWDLLANADCKVATSYEGCPSGSGYENCPTLRSPGNFVVQTSPVDKFTVKSYSPGN